MPDGTSQWGLLVPSVFFGLQNNASALDALQALARLGDVGDPRGPWFMADNLITYGHTRGFLSVRPETLRVIRIGCWFPE